MNRAASLLVALIAATGAAALDLPANARLTAERITQADRYSMPIAPFDGFTIPVQAVDGRIVRRAWQIPGANLTPLQVLGPLRAQYQAAGFDIVLDCAADRCGGFDFRFGTEVLPAPSMFVDLQSFHVVTMRKGPDDSPEAVVSLLVSAGNNSARLQVIEATVEDDAGLMTVLANAEPEPLPEPAEAPPVSLNEGLGTQGFHVLGGLDFESGSRTLGPGPFDSLAELAAFLAGNPDLRVALVGHTDTVGTLDGNIAISRDRARSVRQRLIDEYGVAPSRLDAEGMGYLAPRASNLTAGGREANRRVEAVVLAPE